MSARDKKLVLGAVCVVGALALLKNPKCGHGCRTVAEHVLSYGIDDLATVLLA